MEIAEENGRTKRVLVLKTCFWMKIWFLRSHQKNANLQKNVKKQTVSKAATNAAKRKQGFD